MASNKSKTPTPAPEQALIEGLLSTFFQLLKWIFNLFVGKKGEASSKKLALQAELNQLREHWESVEMYVMQETTRAQAVSEADKIFDSALKAHRVPGETMGERLKAAESRFSKEIYNQIWQAHKLRNSLAHEIGVKVSSAQAQTAVGSFRAGLYELKVLR